VIIRAVFIQDGTIGNMKVMKGLGYGLDERGLEAVGGLVFLPARKDGKFVSFSKTVNVEFNLR
jgi:TonB-like protein